LRSPADVYASYNTQSSILARAEAGTIYAIIDSTEKNHWIKIKYVDQQTAELKEGWIKEDLQEAPPYLLSTDDDVQITEHQGESRFANGNSNQNTNPIRAGASVGLILCESLSLRANADTTATRITTIWYGEYVEIIQDAGSWLRVRFYQNNGQFEGWLLSDYVLQNPAFFTATMETPAYAYPSTSAKRVGLIDAGVELPIIAETEGFYVVSLRAASAFIQKK